jgi:hypothetical protein
MKFLLSAAMVVLALLASVHGEKDGWFVETDFTGMDLFFASCHSPAYSPAPFLLFILSTSSYSYLSDGSCQNVEMLYIISVLARNQTTDCFTTSTGSAMQVCDLTSTPIHYYTETSTDADCSAGTTFKAVGSSYCMQGISNSVLLTCDKQNHKTVTPAHIGSTTLFAGYAYFDGAKCKTADFYHAELAPVTSCPSTYERMLFPSYLFSFHFF